MHIPKTILFGKGFNAVSPLVFLIVSISIFVSRYQPVLSVNPPLPATQLASTGTIVDVVRKNGFYNLVKALEAADLIEMLSSKDPYTIFAPTDAAFKSLPPGTFDKLLNPANKDTLKKILTYHIVRGSINLQKLKSEPLQTVEGKPFVIKVYGRITVNKADVVAPNDIKASNGFIHAIDKVIIPPDVKL
ncbi:MAG: fasciclin domain-containing protein [Nostoc sp.]|uniref:fasciclin domain-containing protein n=1 Tax=Nostoc sp. TaxID=1180 RepID=UPI002FF7A708